MDQHQLFVDVAGFRRMAPCGPLQTTFSQPRLLGARPKREEG
jgi:hypothetical protein